MAGKAPLAERLRKQIPNAMTTLRLLLLAPYVMLLLAGNRVGATIMYVIALLSDLDGTVARRLKATSRFGSFYDPSVDAVFMVTAFLLLFVRGSVELAPLAIYWASALARLVFTLANYRVERELRSTYVSKTIAFSGYLSVLLATAGAALVVTSALLLAGAIANIALTVFWLADDRLRVRRA